MLHLMLHPATPPHAVAAARTLLRILPSPPGDALHLADLALVALHALRSRALHAVAVPLAKHLADALGGGDGVEAPRVVGGVEALLAACGAVCGGAWQDHGQERLLQLWAVRVVAVCVCVCVAV